MNNRINPLGRRLVVLLLLILALWLFCSNIHFLFAKKISLHQPEKEICQIDFGYSPWDENLIIHSLNETEFETFLKSMLDLRCYKRSSPSGHRGSLYVQITYYDGAVEILGSGSLRYISSELEEHDGWYYLMEKDLYKLFFEYTDLSGLPYLE